MNLTFDELARELERSMNAPQPSERWALYRLIAPVIDYANRDLGLKVYFEFPQNSRHGSSQSLDVALLTGHGECHLLLEAKRVARDISIEQISKYLLTDCRAIVTNGGGWLLSDNGRTIAKRLFSSAKSEIDTAALADVIAFIKGELNSDESWQFGNQILPALIITEAYHKLQKAFRRSNYAYSAADFDSAMCLLDSHCRPSVVDRAFLNELLRSCSAGQLFPPRFDVKIRSSRVVIVDRCPLDTGRKRLVRLEVGKGRSDVLVSSALAATSETLDSVVTGFAHDKGAHMRRFRLGDETVAKLFAKSLASAMAKMLK